MRPDDPGSDLGGVIHSYQGYNPAEFPSPSRPPPDMVSGAMNQMLMYGSMRRLTPEELAQAVHLDPSQIKGLGPSLDALMAMLEERKHRILARFESESVSREANRVYRDAAQSAVPPERFRRAFDRHTRQEQLYELEQLWLQQGDDQSPFAVSLMRTIAVLGDKYQVDQLVAKYTFSGRESMTVPQALEIKAELEEIDRLLEQLREARKTARIALIDLESLAPFSEPGQMDELKALRQQVEDYIRHEAERQGLEFTPEGYRLTPKALRLFQSRLLEIIFTDLQESRSGRHTGPVQGEGAVERTRTKAYEFGDSLANMDVTQSLVNTMIRSSTRPAGPLRMNPDDIEIHLTRNTPRCATAVIMDMSGSMRYDGLYVNVKRMALALDGLVRREYPGDWLQFIEMYTFAKARHISEVPLLMPKPVTMFDPVIRLRADMSDPHISEMDVPPHFTNIQRSLQLARQLLSVQNTPNRQIVLMTDGLPTAHFEAEQLLLLYPPHPRTEEATMREARLCRREGIVLNVILLPNWSQSHEDVQFAQRMVEETGGRVMFSGGQDLDRFVVWDYLSRRRSIIS